MWPDKDQDGVFRWVDKTQITFSNYGPGWPVNTANLWDCGQIFTGRIYILNWHIHIFSLEVGIARPASAEFMLSSRKLWWQMGNNQLLQEPWLHLWDDRWTEPKANINSRSVRLRGPSSRTVWLTLCNNCVIVLLQIPTATVDICCMGTSAISLRLSLWKTGRMPRLTVSQSRLTWPASTHRKNWVS